VSVLRNVVSLFVLSLTWGCGAGRDVVLGDLPMIDADAALGREASAPDGSEPEGGALSDVALPDTGSDAGFCAGGEPVSSALRALLTEAIGFGAFATGGANGCVYHVTSLADGGPGSLREAADRVDPLWIVFDVSGAIELASAITFRSHKTVDGRGQKVTVRNFGFTINAGVSNVVVENLTFIGNMQGSNNDGFQIADGAQIIWIDHCALSSYGDGLVDITHGATDVTVSWSVFSMHKFAVLIGRHPDDIEDVNIRVTLHHNWWNQTESYAPRLRFGKAHVFNNLIDRWGEAASASTMGGEILSESNIFIALDDKMAIGTKAGNDDVRGRAKSVGDTFQNGATTETWEPDLVFQPTYSYRLQLADAALQTDIVTNAGPR
jgi:pectate lyase